MQYLKKDSVSTKELKSVHRLEVERDDGVVVVNRVINNQPVWRLLPVQDRCTEVLLVLLAAPRGGKVLTSPQEVPQSELLAVLEAL